MINTTKKYINDGLIIEYSEPRIQPFHEGYFEPISEEDIMYFYYTIRIYAYKELDSTGDELILAKKELVFEAQAYDFPKVNYIQDCIDDIVKEPCTLKLFDYEDDGYHQVTYYNQSNLRDYANCEYWYKIERYDIKVKQRSSNEYENFKEYALTIGKGFGNAGCSSKKENGGAVYLNNLSEENLLMFRDVCKDFVKSAVDYYNEDVEKISVKCPHCNKRFNLNGTNIKDEYDDYIYKCSNCEKIVKEDDYEDFWENISPN